MSTGVVTSVLLWLTRVPRTHRRQCSRGRRPATLTNLIFALSHRRSNLLDRKVHGDVDLYMYICFKMCKLNFV